MISRYTCQHISPHKGNEKPPFHQKFYSRIAVKLIAYTCTCNCNYMYVQLHVHVYAINLTAFLE